MQSVRPSLLLVLGILALAACDPSGGGGPPPEPYNLTVKVLRSAGGAPVQGATVEIALPDGTPVASGTSNASGDARLWIDAAGDYRVLSSKDGHAQGAYQGRVELGGWLDIYCYELGMVSYAATAPRLSGLQYFDGAEWIDCTPGMSVSSQDLKTLKATFESAASLAETASSGLGITLSLDSGRASQSYGFYETAIGPDSSVETISGSTITTTATWDLELEGLELPAGDYAFSFIAFDWANNRLEASLSFASTDTVSGDPDIRAIRPLIDWIEANTWGVENTVFSMEDPGRAAVYHEGIPSSSRIRVAMKVEDGAAPMPIRGIEVWRAANGGIPILAGELVLGALVDNNLYGFDDVDARLEPGVEYTYTIKAKNATGTSLSSEPKSVILLPPHHVYLTSPANGAISASTAPILRFKVSTPSLLASTDYYSFNLQVKDMAGNVVYDEAIYYSSWDQAFFHYDDDTVAAEYTLSAATGTISLNLGLASVELAPNTSYQWNVLWEWDGPYFLRYYEDEGCLARGYSANYDSGYDADNGWFTLSIAAGAN